MAQISWGKGLLETSPSTNGEVADNATWTAIDTPKEDTLKLNPTAGQEKTVTEEGGDIVDARQGKTTYTLEFDLFVKKGSTRPFTDEDGRISGEHAFRFTPEDESCEGFLIERSSVRVEESFSCAEGKLLHYVARALKPTTGNSLKPYTKTTSPSS